MMKVQSRALNQRHTEHHNHVSPEEDVSTKGGSCLRRNSIKLMNAAQNDDTSQTCKGMSGNSTIRNTTPASGRSKTPTSLRRWRKNTTDGGSAATSKRSVSSRRQRERGDESVHRIDESATSGSKKDPASRGCQYPQEIAKLKRQVEQLKRQNDILNTKDEARAKGYSKLQRRVKALEKENKGLALTCHTLQQRLLQASEMVKNCTICANVMHTICTQETSSAPHKSSYKPNELKGPLSTLSLDSIEEQGPKFKDLHEVIKEEGEEEEKEIKDGEEEEEEEEELSQKDEGDNISKPGRKMSLRGCRESSRRTSTMSNGPTDLEQEREQSRQSVVSRLDREETHVSDPFSRLNNITPRAERNTTTSAGFSTSSVADTTAEASTGTEATASSTSASSSSSTPSLKEFLDLNFEAIPPDPDSEEANIGSVISDARSSQMPPVSVALKSTKPLNSKHAIKRVSALSASNFSKDDSCSKKEDGGGRLNTSRHAGSRLRQSLHGLVSVARGNGYGVASDEGPHTEPTAVVDDTELTMLQKSFESAGAESAENTKSCKQSVAGRRTSAPCTSRSNPMKMPRSAGGPILSLRQSLNNTIRGKGVAGAAAAGVGAGAGDHANALLRNAMNRSFNLNHSVSSRQSDATFDTSYSNVSGTSMQRFLKASSKMSMTMLTEEELRREEEDLLLTELEQQQDVHGFEYEGSGLKDVHREHFNETLLSPVPLRRGNSHTHQRGKPERKEGGGGSFHSTEPSTGTREKKIGRSWHGREHQGLRAYFQSTNGGSTCTGRGVHNKHSPDQKNPARSLSHTRQRSDNGFHEQHLCGIRSSAPGSRHTSSKFGSSRVVQS